MPERAELEAAVQKILGICDPRSFLVDLSWNAKRRELTLLVDTDEGIRLHECAALHWSLREGLTEAGLIDEDCGLEVGSPGVGRPLRDERQYRQNVGRTVEVQLADGARLSGRLVQYENQTLSIAPRPAAESADAESPQPDLAQQEIPLSQVRSTHVIPTIN